MLRLAVCTIRSGLSEFAHGTMPVMPGVRGPALWSAIAAIAISVVAVAAIAASGGPRRPLTFAGSVLLPDGPFTTSAAAPHPAAPRTTIAPAGSAGPVTSTSVVPSNAGNPAPIVAVIQSPGGAPDSRAAATPSSARPAASAPPASHPTSNRPSQPAVPTSSTIGSNRVELAKLLFTALNDARRQAGLPPLAWNIGLQRSAARHNRLMAAVNRLQARVGDEPALGARQANEGVAGRYAGENLALSETIGNAGALAAQQLMLTELPPADNDRRNLLSSTLDSIGIDVLVDRAHGRLWITQDFAQLS